MTDKPITTDAMREWVWGVGNCDRPNDGEMSKLNEAIEVMEDAIAEAHWAGCEPEERSCQDALAILQAAAKVSGDIAVKVWDWLHSESAICPPWVNQENSRAIRALLAALPDAERAGKGETT